MHQELTGGKLEDELVVPSNTRVYSIAKVMKALDILATLVMSLERS